MVERDDAALALGQPLDRGPHLRRFGRGDGEVLGAGAHVDEWSGVERDGLWPEASGAAAGGGADQAQQPSGERSRVVERAHVSEREGERLLGDVLRLVEVPAEPDRCGDDEVLEPVDERWPRVSVATLGGGHERGPTVTVLGERHHRRGALLIHSGYRLLGSVHRGAEWHPIERGLSCDAEGSDTVLVTHRACRRHHNLEPAIGAGLSGTGRVPRRVAGGAGTPTARSPADRPR